MPIELAKSNIIYSEGNRELIDKIKNVTDWVYPYTPKTLKTSVTRLASQDGEDEKRVYAPFAVSKDTRATEIGNAYHKFLETLDYNVSFEDNFASFCKNFKKASLLIKKDFAHATYTAIKERIGKGKCYRELPFVYKQNDGIMVQGVIDLLIIHADGSGEIIDYKAAMPSEKMLAVYKKQLNSYKEAAQQIADMPIEKTSLYAISAAKFIDV